jgi:hypothetical protein
MEIEKYKLLIYGFVICAILSYIVYSVVLVNKSIEMFNNKNYHFIHIPKNAGTSIRELLTDSDIPIEYIDHNYPLIMQNEVVVLRDPIDRFISGYYYSKNRWNERFSEKYKTPNELAEALYSDDEEAWNYIGNTKTIINNRNNVDNIDSVHTINGKISKYTWVFCPQKFWINNPKYILRFSHLNDDFNKCLQDLGYNKKFVISKKNTTTHKNKELSEDALKFLHKFYKKDFELFNKNTFTYRT